MFACTWWYTRRNTRVHMTQCYKKFTLILAGESSGYQREVQMVIQLGSIQRFAVSVRKDVSYRGGKVGVQRNWIWKKHNDWQSNEPVKKTHVTFFRIKAFRLNYKKRLVP